MKKQWLITGILITVWVLTLGLTACIYKPSATSTPTTTPTPVEAQIKVAITAHQLPKLPIIYDKYKPGYVYDIDAIMKDPKLTQLFSATEPQGAAILGQYYAAYYSLPPKYQAIWNDKGSDAAIKAYNDDLALLPTTTAELSEGARFLIRKTAEREGKSVEEALAKAPRPVVFDMDKIVGNSRLEQIFKDVVPNGAAIVDAYYAITKAGAWTKDGNVDLVKAKAGGVTDTQLATLGIQR